MNGSMPQSMIVPATTAEKLKTQPTDRSISRMTMTKTMPMANMPVKAALESS